MCIGNPLRRASRQDRPRAEAWSNGPCRTCRRAQSRRPRARRASPREATMAAMTGVSAILLAAGGSTRFGRSKMLEEVDGTPLVRRTASILLEGGVEEFVVVLGAGA